MAESLNEGIIFQGFLLSKEDFIQQFIEQDDVFFNNFMQAIYTLYTDISLHSLTTGEIYQRWDKIQQDYFSGTMILEIFSQDQEINFSPIVNEANVVSDKGYIYSKNLYNQIDAINRVKKAEEFKQMITNHYKQLLDTIESNTLSKSQAHQAHIQQYYSIERANSAANAEINAWIQKKKAQRVATLKARAKQSFTGKTFREVIYQGMINQQYEGKVWDAFMNHVGDYHKEIIAALANPSLIEGLMNSFFANGRSYAKSVYAEEGNHFIKLLYDSLNSTPWYASGDIVIIDSEGRVIYNIQLKTTTNKQGAFHIRTKLLTSLLQKITELGSDRQKIAELLFDQLKTQVSNNIYRKESELEKSIYSFVEKQIGVKF